MRFFRQVYEQRFGWLACLVSVAGSVISYHIHFWIGLAVNVVGMAIAIKATWTYSTYIDVISLPIATGCIGLTLDLQFQEAILYFFIAGFFAGAIISTRNIFVNYITNVRAIWLEPVLFLPVLAAYLGGVFWRQGYDPIYLYVGLILPIIGFMAMNAQLKMVIACRKLIKRGTYKVVPGMPAPDFELPNSDGKKIKLSDKRGQIVLLLFVRGDWCPSCHMILRTYERERHQFQAHGVQLLVIGPDPEGVNKRMAERLGLTFEILSDTNLQVTSRYGLNPDTKIDIMPVEGFPLPAGFLIDPQGICRYTTRPEDSGKFLKPDSIFPILAQISNSSSNEQSVNPVSTTIKSKSTLLPVQSSENINEKDYATIVEQANDSILALDIVDGKILNANQQLAELLGYSREMLLSKTIFELYPEAFYQHSAVRIADVWEKKGMVFDDIPFQSSAGEQIPVECSAKVLPYGGRPAIILYCRDIRERLALEKRIRLQTEIIEEKNKDLVESIEYASRIQAAILPGSDTLRACLQAHYLYFRPRDIVSGDFFWAEREQTLAGEEVVLFCVADCTGHGVPGAFMSMLGINLLNQIIDDEKVFKADQILTRLDKGVRRALKQTQVNQTSQDGMDICLCIWYVHRQRLEFASAGRPLYLKRAGEKQVTAVKGNNFPVGGAQHTTKHFELHSWNIQPGDRLYLFSDGITDQFGGVQKRKFTAKRLKELIEETANDVIETQGNRIAKTLDDWKATTEQLDDMTLLIVELSQGVAVNVGTGYALYPI
jgi:PAS domain S-box-containing protein